MLLVRREELAMAPDAAALARAQDAFDLRLGRVEADQWSLPTVCPDWTVRDLVNHVVVGSTMSVRLLDGAALDQIMALFGSDALGDDPLETRRQTVAAEREAFAAPGALDRIVHHPAGDIPGAVLLGFRTGDNLLHTWDLARATGGDEVLPDDVVADVWSVLEPFGPSIGTLGVFGDGPSGTVGPDAPLQTRLLDLSGRRP
jgi:uncharacterized protein (TIGR03086 family)